MLRAVILSLLALLPRPCWAGAGSIGDNRTVSTGTITAYQGGGWAMSQVGSYTVTPGTGTFTVQNPAGQAIAIVSTGTLTVGTHAVTQSGAWTVTPGTGTFAVSDSVTQSDLATINTTQTNGSATTKQTGSFTVTAGTGTWSTTPADSIAVGVRASTGVTVQELKDTGRQVIISSAGAATGVTTEALFTLTTSTAFLNGVSGTSFGVTTGKTLRLQNFNCAWETTGATAVGGRCHLRVQASGACTATSPMVAVLGADIPSGGLASNAAGADHMLFPDGFELTGTQTFCISHLESTTSSSVDAVLMGYQY